MADLNEVVIRGSAAGFAREILAGRPPLTHPRWTGCMHSSGHKTGCAVRCSLMARNSKMAIST